MIKKRARKPMPYLEFPCIPIEQGKNKLVFFSARTSTVWSLVQINKRDPDKDTGYQRALSASRVKAIAKYIDNGNPIPITILISLNAAKLSDDRGTLCIPKRKDSGWVIDGQHRLAGAHEADADIELGVIAFLGLKLEAQIGQFVTINKEAKGVPTSLYYDLLKKLPYKKKESEVAKERAADIAAELKNDERSPFYKRIVVVTSPTRGELSLTNFVRKVAPLVTPKKGKFNLYLPHEQTKIISNYYAAFGHVFPEVYDRHDSIFFQTIGFGALMNALPTVFDLALKRAQGFTLKDVIQILKSIDYFNFDDWRDVGTGNAAELQAGEDLRQELLGAFSEDLSKEGSIRL